MELTVSLACLYTFVIKPARSPLNAIPGPPPASFILGNLRELLDNHWDEGNYPEPCLSWAQKYGGAVLYRTAMFHRVILTDPDALKHIYQTNGDNYPRDTSSRSYLRHLIGGDGLLSSEGRAHKDMRKLLAPHFAFGNVKSFVGVFQRHTHRLCAYLDSVDGTGLSIDLQNLFTQLSLDIIGLSAFGYDFGSLAGENSNTLRAYHTLSAPVSLPYVLGQILVPGFARLPLPALREAEAAKAVLFKVVDDVVEAKLKRPATKTSSLDLLDLMLDSATNHTISAAQARVHVLTFLLAGHETTSVTLSWVFAMLARHPDAAKRVRDECRAVLQGNDVTWTALGELKYTTAVIHETLRLFPTITHPAMRLSSADDVVPMTTGKPMFLPKGTTIFIHLGVLHRNPKYWFQPSEFIPDRFLEGTSAFLADKALRGGRSSTYFYMPFSTGGKNCIGMRFAMAELQVVVATLVAKYSFQLSSEANTHPKMTGISLKPTHLTMHVTAAT
ncbi:hypothetical protein ACHHYP_04099 [Achlya hypogyna]|uniref:Cytochrome P450 n=1 Tax=Achlya hypogyna TaxID=1202772 RepID=A0A1V9Z244_ACHHY|nr:hypothetical protein ACHHYP_04099 [Achlya hypogyna]